MEQCNKDIIIPHPDELKCSYIRPTIEKVTLRKDSNGNTELVIGDNVYRHGEFEIVKNQDGSYRITLSF